MHRSIVFAALLGGVGLGAWSSFSAPLKPPGLDFSALVTTLQQYVIQHQGPQPAAELAPVQLVDSQASEHTILLNAALAAGNAASFAPAPQPGDLPVMHEAMAPQDVCGAWSISEVGMEAILKEMISRGWTPPARSEALGVSQSAELTPIEALDPDSPVAPIVPNTHGESDTVRKPPRFTN